ncbi:MAG: hypothetical protein JNK04_19305, partial [Myxococcales bacterium]|nr:hypothetical protein [Myxococcales bacterium]
MEESKLEKGLPASAPRTARIIVGLFDLAAYRNHDPELVAFIKEHGDAVVALEQRFETTFEG